MPRSRPRFSVGVVARGRSRRHRGEQEGEQTARQAFQSIGMRGTLDSHCDEEEKVADGVGARVDLRGVWVSLSRGRRRSRPVRRWDRRGPRGPGRRGRLGGLKRKSSGTPCTRGTAPSMGSRFAIPTNHRAEATRDRAILRYLPAPGPRCAGSTFLLRRWDGGRGESTARYPRAMRVDRFEGPPLPGHPPGLIGLCARATAWRASAKCYPGRLARRKRCRTERPAVPDRLGRDQRRRKGRYGDWRAREPASSRRTRAPLSGGTCARSGARREKY